MEFNLDSPHINIIIKDNKDNLGSIDNNSVEENIFKLRTSGDNGSLNLNSLQSPKDVLETSSMKSTVSYEIIIKLNDFYLINNLKLYGKVDEIILHKLKFQNINTGAWVNATFFNPDNDKEVVTKDEESISVFCVGLTDHIKMSLCMIVEEDLLDEGSNSNMPLAIQTNPTHCYSSNSKSKQMSYKKNFNLNLELNTGIIPYSERRANYYVDKCIQYVKSIISNLVIYSQYIYSIPNSQFLMTLLNLKNYFEINTDKFQTEENYLSSLFLTACSMIQARLFIQAWELFHKLQLYIAYQMNYNNFNFFRILLDVNNNQAVNHMLLSNSSEDIDIKSRAPIFLTKIEIIKAICMFEHGHMLTFFNCLRNCIRMYFINDFTGLKVSINWTKQNEIGSDKFYIQGFLTQNGVKLVEILSSILKDKSEIVTFSALKIIEFVIDYNPNVLVTKLNKIIKVLLQILVSPDYKYGKPYCSGREFHNRNDFLNLFASKDIYFPEFFYFLYFEDSQINKKIPSGSKSNNTMSPILLKQINYTLDTIVNVMDNLSSKDIQLILKKTSSLLIDILKNEDKDSAAYMNAIKLFQKLVEGTNSNYLEHLSSNTEKMGSLLDVVVNLYLLSLKPNSRTLFKEYIERKLSATNRTQKSGKTQLVLIDTGEVASFVSTLFEKMSDECIILNGRECYMTLLSSLTTKLEILFKFIESSQENENKEFAIYYTYIILTIVNTIYFNKSEVKSPINRMFREKISSEVIEILSRFILVLIKIEQLTLRRKEIYILFEVVMEVLNKLNDCMGTVIQINFTSLLLSQYEDLLRFISTSGIFNENIFFLLKTLPLIDIDSDKKMNGMVTSIFKVVLKNFTNYYNEDMFQLFNLLLGKVVHNIDDTLMSEIVTAIVNKSNYKGSSFKFCCERLFQCIIDNNYYDLMKKQIQLGLKIYLDSSNKFSGDKLMFKDNYIELIERLEFLRKYFEYLRCTYQSNDIEVFLNLLGELIYTDSSFIRSIFQAVDIGDETIIVKLNEIIIENFEIFGNVIKFELDETNTQRYICMIKSQLDFVVRYFQSVNKNHFVIADNIKSMAKILSRFNSIALTFKESSYMSNSYKMCSYRKLFDVVSPCHFKDYNNKPLMSELMNFFELMITNTYELENECELKEYYFLINNILMYNFDSCDELQVTFAIEVLLKNFNIRFDTNEPLRIEEYGKFTSYVHDSIWEKIYNLYDHYNFKIALFALLIIQIFSPRETIDPLRKIKTSRVPKMNSESSLISLKPIEGDSFWLTREEIENLFNFIKEKIIYDYKIKITIVENQGENVPTNYNQNDDMNIYNRRIDEVNDIEQLADTSKESPLEPVKQINIQNILDDDNLTLEDLGVFEVEDEILENFDEANIPVLKNNYNKKKGSAEKLKTNQNSKNLLMSNYNHGKASETDGLTSCNKLEENSQMKKTNIRPLNGLRPSTPPLKNNGGNNIQSNSTNITGNLPYESVPVIKYSNASGQNRRNCHNKDSNADSKYEIKSMEELFIEEEQKLQSSPQNIYDSFENLNIEDFDHYDNNPTNAVITSTDELNGINGIATLNGLDGIKLLNLHPNNLNRREDDIKIETCDIEDVEVYLENDYTSTHGYEEGNENIIDSIDEIKSNEITEQRQSLRNARILSRRPPTRYGNRKDQVLMNSNSPENGRGERTFSTERKILSVNSILKNKSKFKSFSSGRRRDINNTFSATSNVHDHINSPGSPEKSEVYCNSQINYQSSSEANLNTTEPVKKSIHNLHSLSNYSKILKRDDNNENKNDFRKTLRLKLSQNTNKILHNLKKLGNYSKTIDTSLHRATNTTELEAEDQGNVSNLSKNKKNCLINTNHTIDYITENNTKTPNFNYDFLNKK